MSNDIEDDTHDKLVKAVLRYLYWNQRFLDYGYEDSAKRARTSLTEVTKLIRIRREEIWQKRLAIHGHKRKGIAPTDPDERRQRKLDRQAQKQQGKK